MIYIYPFAIVQLNTCVLCICVLAAYYLSVSFISPLSFVDLCWIHFKIGNNVYLHKVTGNSPPPPTPFWTYCLNISRHSFLQFFVTPFFIKISHLTLGRKCLWKFNSLHNTLIVIFEFKRYFHWVMEFS